MWNAGKDVIDGVDNVLLSHKHCHHGIGRDGKLGIRECWRAPFDSHESDERSQVEHKDESKSFLVYSEERIWKHVNLYLIEKDDTHDEGI